MYCIYGYNDGKLHYDTPATGHFDLPRGDMQLDAGFRVKLSTDHGRSYPTAITATIPVRRTKIDRENPWNGVTMGAFHCDKPVIINHTVYFAFEKVR